LSLPPAGGPELQIVSLNIRHGGGRRSRSILDWIAARSADVIVLPEWRDSTAGNLVRRGLESAGFDVSPAFARTKQNGILIAAKEPCSFYRLTPASSERGELLSVELASGWRLLAAYFPQGNAKAPFFKACTEEAQSSNASPFVLIGDLNTGCNEDDVEGTGTPFMCADLFDALATKAHLADLWRVEHRQEREWSWRSKVNGFRVDHAFANKAFRTRFSQISCFYDHGPRETGLSDHSALIVKCTPASNSRL
jgi:exonuclease III